VVNSTAPNAWSLSNTVDGWTRDVSEDIARQIANSVWESDLSKARWSLSSVSLVRIGLAPTP
jgi:hypothetical protein